MEAADKHLALLVSNDYDTMQILEQTFVRAGFRVLMATNLEETVAAVQTEMPDIVLCDSDSKAVNRQNLQRQMTDEIALENLPFIFLCKAQPGQEASGFLELDQYASKPFDPIALATLAERTLAYRKTLSESAELTDRLAAADHKAIRKEVSREIHRVKRYGGCMSLCIFDVVEQATNSILKAPTSQPVVYNRIADMVPDLVRTVDIITRLSRKRFLWVMPETDARGAELAVKRLMGTFANMPMAEIRAPLTIQAGLATAPDDGMDYQELVQLAEQQLINSPLTANQTAKPNPARK